MTSKAGETNPKELFSRIQIQSRQKRSKIDRNSVARFCAALLQSLELSDRSLSVVFVGIRTIRSLNTRYRQKNYATDVLSFSYGREVIDDLAFLGEIIIAPEVAVNQALRYGVPPDWELRRLIVHGVLHLMGYDHESDRGQMNRLQNKLLRRKFFLDAPPLGELKGNP
jgi:probable rRNA maturation factor